MKLHGLRPIIGLFLAVLSASSLFAQLVPFDDPRWEFKAETSKIEEYKGKQSLYLKGGFANLKEVSFLNGSIEFDIAVPNVRGFAGASFRKQDEANYEEFYIRFHQSGNPDAMQYTPVFNGYAGWQLYYGAGYGIPFKYVFDEWMHIKIVFAGNQGEVYFNGSEEPTLFIPELKRDARAGGVTLACVTPTSEAHFANFRYTTGDFMLKGKPDEQAPSPKGTVTQWQVSEAMEEAKLGMGTGLDKSFLSGLKWSATSTEKTGLVNLARFASGEQQKNTLLVKIQIQANALVTKRLDLGFSDQVKVYLNGQLLFQGNDGFNSRDYRFLGTIGYFDSVYLPLKKGQNELVLAITEGFGGWGIKAKIEDREGIRLE